MLREIQHWIDNGKPYQKGVELYNQFGASNVLKQLFRVQSPYTESKLLAELVGMLGQQREPVVRPVTLPTYSPAELPKEIQAEFENKKRLFGQLTQAHGDLYHAQTDKHRAAIRARIIELLDQIERIWQKADAHMASLQPPVPKPAKTKSELILERNRLRVKISKAKSKSNANKIAELQLELAKIQQQIEHAAE
jgi:tellurite resistance-related uncharacterized protein